MNNIQVAKKKEKKKKKIHVIHKAELNPRIISKYKLYVH